MERTGAVIVGAGPAGLAVAACLGGRGVAFALLEREGTAGAFWRRHYDRLHLHTHKRNSGLPGRPWPDAAPDYPARDEVVAYLEDYAAALDLRPRLGEAVERAAREDGAWRVATAQGTYAAEHLVIATGLNDQPHRPSWPGLGRFPGNLLHSSEYRNGVPFRGRGVLVVGFGNSGGEIAVDLVEHGAHVALSVRSPVNVVPRRMLGRPVEEIATRLERLPPSGRRRHRPDRAAPALRRRDPSWPALRSLQPHPAGARARPHPTHRRGTIALVRAGRIAVRPGVERLDGERVAFVVGSHGHFDAIVLATGYRVGSPAFLEGVGEVDARLLLVPPEALGLHFCGFTVTAGGTLSRIGREAEAIAGTIAAQVVGQPDANPATSTRSVV